MKKLLVLGLIVVSLDLIGVCSLEQRTAFSSYSGAEKMLASITGSDKYQKAAELLAQKAAILAQKFPKQNLFEIKTACDTAYREKKLTDELVNFVRLVLYPLRIRAVFSGNPEDSAAAEKFFKTMIELGLFASTDLEQVIALSSEIIVLEDRFKIPTVLLIPYLWKPLLTGPKDALIFTKDQSEKIFSQILVPFIRQNGLRVLGNDAVYVEFLRALFDADPLIQTMTTDRGKTILHHLFEQDLSGLPVTGQTYDWGYTFQGMLQLPLLEDFEDQNISHAFSQDMKIPDFIADLAKSIGAAVDGNKNSLLHILRKNSKYGRKDADIRFIIETEIRKKIGTSLDSLQDAAGRRASQYPLAFISDAARKDFLDRYILHAFNQFAESLTTLI